MVAVSYVPSQTVKSLLKMEISASDTVVDVGVHFQSVQRLHSPETFVSNMVVEHVVRNQDAQSLVKVVDFVELTEVESDVQLLLVQRELNEGISVQLTEVLDLAVWKSA